jgi:cell fate (sporulation/competence/biofilm development) regulator YmcA (YheA/YmcA/DUF963 family)
MDELNEKLWQISENSGKRSMERVMKQINFNDDLYDELQKIMKLHAQARSCKKIGSTEEAKAFRSKADKLAVVWARRLRRKGID